MLFQQVVGDLSRLEVSRPGSLDQAGPSARLGPPLGLADTGGGTTNDGEKSATPKVRHVDHTEGKNAQSCSSPTEVPAAVHRPRASMSIVPNAAYDPWYTHSMRHAPSSAAVMTARISEIPDPTTCGVQAWFVMRELVQGERRHGWLLANGIAVSIFKTLGLLGAMLYVHKV